jgi:hypothetical protein
MLSTETFKFREEKNKKLIENRNVNRMLKKTENESVGNIGRVGFFSLSYHWKNVADLANNVSIHRCI